MIRKLPFYSIIISLLWWTYLGAAAQPLIVQDAVGYKQLADTIYHDGFWAYFNHGPTREPLYPILISFSLRISDALHISFITIQLIFQILCLFITQLLVWNILRRLGIHTVIQSIVLLYFGLSPSLNNAALSLFSEVLIFPFILILILIFQGSIKIILSQGPNVPYRYILALGQNIGLMFLFCLLVKGIFEAIFLLMVLCLILVALFRKEIFSGILFLVLGAIISFELPLTFYKFLNYHNSGHFTYTDRGPWLLYGNMARRVMPLSTKDWQTAVAYIPGLDFCELKYKDNSCTFWSSETSDNLGAKKRAELERQGFQKKSLDNALMREARTAFLSHPWQATSLMAIESLKIFFYETTHIGFVVYPNWLKNIYNNELFNQSLKFFIALLSFISLLYTLYKLIVVRNLTPITQWGLAAICFIIIAFAFLHAPLLIIPRYALPIASLQMILMAFFLNQMFFRNSK